ncbi:uncharacterized protein LOC110841753 [Folsomia candida]|nr:uncharacterized protein LOC110841753 [Folsomia candida]
MHPDFVILDETCDSTDNIALIQVTPPFETNQFVQPIALVSPQFEIIENMTLIQVAGWGLTSEFGGIEPAEIMHKLQLPTISDAECKAAYDSHACLDGTITFEETDFCAVAWEGYALCVHDGGDPAVCYDAEGDYALCGVANDIYCGDITRPQRFAELSQFHDWIVSSMEPEQLDNSTWVGQDDTCGGILVGSSGRVTFNSSSNRNHTCTWTIRANSMSSVSLSFEKLNIPPGDAVFVTTIDSWTGLVEQNYKFTRSEEPVGPSFVVTGPLLMVTYVADGNTQTTPESGFNLDFQGAGFSYSVRRRFSHTELQSVAGTLRYPEMGESGEMVPYNNSETATFAFSGQSGSRANVTIFFTSIEDWNDQCNGDGINVLLFNPLEGFIFSEQICGVIVQPISYILNRAVGESIALVFQTDDENTDYGFGIEWQLE